MEPFKNIFNKKSIKIISTEIKKVHKSFDSSSFEKQSNRKLSELELKDRVRQISNSLKDHLSTDYKKNIKILTKALGPKENEQISGFLVWPFTQYIEEHGLDDLDTSMLAMYEMTKRFTAEFSIRPYLEKYGDVVYQKYLNIWVLDKNKHVRRLVSEGTRPNLPWGNKVSWISADPKYNIYLLEKLKNDPEEYVRRSVANHLNDISRLDDKLMLNTLSKWDLKDSNTKWIVRHATRSLLKQGHAKALKLNGYSINPKVNLSKFKLSPKAIKEGERFTFSFELESTGHSTQFFLMDYLIHYPKKNGKLSAKAFRLKSFKLKKGETITISKEVHFKKVTIRKHYSGEHLFEIQISDKIVYQTKFRLLCKNLKKAKRAKAYCHTNGYKKKRHRSS